MLVTISVRDMGVLVLGVLGAAGAFYLILLLHNMNQLLKRSRKLLIRSEGAITRSLTLMAAITGNLNEVSAQIKQNFENTDQDIKTIVYNLAAIGKAVSHAFPGIRKRRKR